MPSAASPNVRALRQPGSSVISNGAALIVVAIGVTVLIGWTFDIDTLKGLLPGVFIMIPNTAVGMIAAGSAVLLGRSNHALRLRASLALGVFVLLLGFALFLERIGGFDFGINLLLFASEVRRYPFLPPGLPATNSTICFVLAGLGILAGHRPSRVAFIVAQSAPVAGLAVAGMALMGYLFGMRPMYAIDKAAGMAILTAWAFSLLHVSILFAVPDRGIAALIRGRDPGGMLIRQLLPPAVLTIAGLGWLWIEARHENLVSVEGGVALFCVLVIGTIVLLVVRSATLLRDADRERALNLERAISAREAAERADSAKSDFLATMSHELRTPLNAIMGYTSLLMDGLPGPVTTDQRAMLERVTISSRHLLTLIDDVLSLSRIELRGERIVLETVNAAELVREVEAIIRPLALAKGLTLEASAPPGGLTLVTDPARMRQVLLNLLGNAVKFTSVGRVELTATANEESVTFTVRDTGIGIAREHQERVFEAFWQVEQTRSRAAEGAGLGLALSRRLVDLLGGRITLASEPGMGTVVNVILDRGFGASAPRVAANRVP